MQSLVTNLNLLAQILAFPLLLDSILRAFLLCARAIKPALPDENQQNPSKGAVVLIAAHDESGTIGPTVASLREQLSEWPNSQLWVVADRCSDSTAEEAEIAGARVARRSDGRIGKGSVIAWWMGTHEEEWRSRDAVLILDADSRLAEGSLNALRRAIAAGGEDAAAFQSFVAPDSNASSGRLAGWSEVLMQRIDDEARRRCGWSVPLRGTGMAFRGEVLAELAPRLHTLAEDLELDVLLASQGKRAIFVPQAIVFDPKPQQSSGASLQRARWFHGQLQVIGDYRREMLEALVSGRLSAWFLLPLLMLRPKILFIVSRLILLLMSVLIPGLFWIAVTGIILDAAYYLAGTVMVDNPRRYLLDMMTAPRYAAMWLCSFGIAAVRRRRQGWLRVGR